jgi:hypothetical protein
MALVELGGSAHLSAILQRVRSTYQANAMFPLPTKCELLETLREHRATSMDSIDSHAWFYQPFGPDSYRWSLCEGASDVSVKAAFLAAK